jgi:PST family polysaccharide transporter
MNQAERFRQLTSTDRIRKNLRASSVRAAAYTGAAGFGDFAIRIGSTAILARLLLPEDFGLVMMVTAVTAIADQLRDLGLSSATVQKKEITHEEVTNLFWVNVLLSAVSALVICACAPLVSMYYKDQRLTVITCVLASTFVAGGLMVQHQALLTRQMKLGHTSSVRLLSSLVSTVLAISLAWMNFGYWALIWREVARSVLLTAGMWLCFPWMPGLPSWKTEIRGLIRFGTHLTGANILATISAGFDRFLIGRFWGAAPVAMYRQAYQLVTAPIDQLLSPIYQVAQPGLSLLQTDDGRYRRFYLKMVVVVCAVTMPLSLFVAVYSKEITALILGHKWGDAAPVLMILSFGTFIKQAVGSSAQILITRGLSKTYMILTLFYIATLVLLMCVGVCWGTVGVAAADVGATYLLMLPRLHYSFKNSPVTMGMFFSTITRPVIASVAMALALILMRSVWPAHALLLTLAMGGCLALVVFSGVWILIPGGRAELMSLVSDLRSTRQRKGLGIKDAETAGIAD